VLILDTDHISALASERGTSDTLLRRLAEAGLDIATTVVTVEEQVRGWLARIKSAKSEDTRILAYAKFQRTIEDLGRGLILPFDGPAAAEFRRLTSLKFGVSNMDLRIDAIPLTTRHMLLSRNLRDFERIPGLKVEN
jgi:tRNA(fMet)-specific endonuclease VapC